MCQPPRREMGAFVKLLFWTDGGSILGLVPPLHPKGSLFVGGKGGGARCFFVLRGVGGGIPYFERILWTAIHLEKEIEREREGERARESERERERAREREREREKKESEKVALP